MIQVVSGVVVRGGRVLMVQRPASKAEFPFGWESPGGKVDDGEGRHVALIRELQEELGITATALSADPLWEGDFLKIAECGGRDFHLTFYVVATFDGEVQLREGQAGFGWFLPDELDSLTLLPANRRALPVIKDLLKMMGDLVGRPSYPKPGRFPGSMDH